MCEDADGKDYVDGNLGKGWNELDLVPHRLTLTAGEQAGATTTHDVIIAGDNSESDGGYEGYDRITFPVINEDLSDASCSVDSFSAQMEEVDITGGVYDGIYRIVRVSQNKGATCVIDWDMRLSNSSALYNGSSLQGYMFKLDDFKTGKQTIPIPVKDVEPQQLKKSATAVRDQRYGWTIAKEVSPEQITFADTCLAWESSEAVTVKVIWNKVGPAPSGKIRYEAVISAVNPARRDVQVTVTDMVYGGVDATGTLIPGSPFAVGIPKTTVPALSTTIIDTVQVDIEGEFTSIYDIATGVYWDPVLNEEIKPDKTVELAAAVGTGDLVNGTALVTDTEAITSGFEFKVGVSGTWGTSSYWEKTVTDSGSETFTKYVRTTKGYSGDGKLSDKATIQGELDAEAQSATGATVLLAKKFATVNVTKSTQDVFEGSESADFTFQLLSEDKQTVVDSKTITVDDNTADDAGKPGYKKSTVSFTSVPSGIYYVRELPTTGWAPNLTDIKVDVTGTICSAGASFTNDPSPASAKVKKVTDPAGFEAGWTFELWKDGAKIDTATTTDDGYVKFTAALGQGSYEVKEVSQAGWKSDGGAASCTFDVNLPGDGGKEFACTFTNTYEPTIKVEKAGDTLAKYYDGESTVDDIDYTIKVTNTSPTPVGPAGAPKLVCKVTDDDISQNTTLSAIGPGEDASWKPSYELPADPWATTAGEFKNTAAVTCKYGASDGPDAPVNGSSSAVSSNTWTTDVFVPSVKVTKSANVDEALVGDTVHWTITAENTSSAKTPDLVFKSFSDVYAPGEGVTNNCTTLAVGDKCTIEYDYIVPKDSGDLDNSAKVEFTLDQTVEAWPNVISDTGRDTVDVVNPSFTVSKACDSGLVAPGGTAKFKVTFTNTGDVPLDITVTGDAADAAQIADFTLATGASVDKYVDITAPELGGAATVGNKVTAKASYKTLWTDTKSSDDSCKIGSYVEVVKTTVGAPSGAPYNWEFRLFEDVSRSVDVGTQIGSGSTGDSGNGTIQFTALLDPTEKYTVCEWNGTPSAAWTATWLTFNGNAVAAGDVWNPDSYLAIPENLGRSCVDFGAGTGYGLTANQRSTFQVENKYQYTGGQRTIGYWKNWSSCSGGNQAAVAERLGGSDAGRWMIDDVLPMTLWGTPPMPNGFAVTSCEDAVSLLGKTAIGAKKPSANDGLYAMVAQMIAAKANYAAGAGQNPDVTAAFATASALLAKYEFNGTGSYLGPKVKGAALTDRNLALQLAGLFDWYNNGMM